METTTYYNENSKAFYDRTIHIDMSERCNAFLKLLPEKANILDAGCGVGRDSNYFVQQGHTVTAFDASEEMVKTARKETGLKVSISRFQDLDFNETFDGIWASASLLHVPYNETRSVYQKIHMALKPNGIFYASYKYGADYMQTAERGFWNMTENTIMPYLAGLFEVITMRKEPDARNKISPGFEQYWLIFMVKKLTPLND